ncbi:MAG: hypothetical protein WKG07_14040 [Hymenobacter sp.]
MSAAGDNAYLVSDRNGIGGSKDIFRIALAPAFKPEVVTLVQGKVLDAVTKKPIRAIIHYENLITGEEVGVAESSPVDGSYTIVLPAACSMATAPRPPTTSPRTPASTPRQPISTPRSSRIYFWCPSRWARR